MSARHPILGITGSSGAGTSSAVRVFERLFAALALKAVIIEGDAYHSLDREGNRKAIERARIRGENFSLFGPQGNHLDRLQALLREYGEKGTGTTRHYLHSDAEAAEHGHPVGTFTPWEPIPAGTDVLFYEGLHGGYVGEDADIASHMDLLIGVVPVINLEWIQKLHRDKNLRGYSHEAVVSTILRRMPDYVNYIVPQFSRTHVNFQRVPTVDTSNPFIARDIPTADESMVVIRFADPKGIDFPYLLEMLHDSMMTRPNSILVPGGKMGLAMQLIFTPMILRLLDLKRRA
ncbi:MAG: phosphoribulokinase [Panacagrimonas sp.]